MQSRKLIGSELPLVERLRKMKGIGDYQLAALMDGVGPQAADEIERLREQAERYKVCGRTLSGYEIEHLFWLAAREVVFFHTWNGETWDGGWQVGISCSDTFCYAAADSESLAPGEEGKLREFYERHGWAGVVAWCAWKRGIEPLKELQNDSYLAARAELTPNDGGNARHDDL